MTAHGDYCRCHACEVEGIEDANPEAAELHAQAAADERAERELAYADGIVANYPELWGDAPW